MDFLNVFGKRVNRVVRSVTEKSGEGTDVARISGEIRALTAECDRTFAEFGRACYELRAGGGDPGNARELCDHIDALQARIAELREQRDVLKAPRRCPACGAMQSRDARYCSSCGKRLHGDAPAPVPPEADALYCPNCGALRGEGAVCALCGRPYEAAEPEEPSAPEPAAVPDIDTEEPAPEALDEAEP